MKPVCVINAVGLTPRHLGPSTPRISALAAGGFSAPMTGVVPAVTCTAQATILTGLSPSGHGIVGNGWHFRDLGETRFWVQANRLVMGEKLYETARARAERRRERFTCAKLFWWFNQGAAVDWSVTPKPFYGADGSKEFAISSQPPELAASLEKTLGPFPFHSFWGPRAGLPSTDWIARAAAEVIRGRRPTLTLVYLPHLDYDFQRFGPDSREAPRRLRELDERVGLVADAAKEQGAAVVLLSEYGLVSVNRPVHLNLELRESGWVRVHPGPFGETLDPFASRAFAVPDHQVAHVYVADPKSVPAAADRIRAIDGVARVLAGREREEVGLDHPRSGDLVVLSQPRSWFTYYYWLNDRDAPDFARTVDIHRKPGYDPCELFVDPAIGLPALRVARRLLQKKLGLRYLMDVVPLEAKLVRGSHGLPTPDPAEGPLYCSSLPGGRTPAVPMTSVKERILNLLGLPQ